MYHDQVKLVPVLMIERNNPVTLSKHEATREKEDKETENNQALLFLECCGIV